MRVCAWVAGDEVEGFPLSVVVVEFYGALPEHVEGEDNDADEERAVERAEEVFSREDVLQQCAWTGRGTRGDVGAMCGRVGADWLLLGSAETE